MGFSFGEIKNYAAFLNSLTPNELGVLASLLGLTLSQGLDYNEQNALGNFLEAIGQIIQCIGTQGQNLESKRNDLNNR